MKNVVLVAVCLITLVTQAQTPDFRAQVDQFFTDYTKVISDLGDPSKSVEDRKVSKRLIRPWVKTTTIRVYDDLDTIKTDTVIRINQYLPKLETYYPHGYKVAYNTANLEYVDLHEDLERNAWRVKATVKKRFEYPVLVPRADSLSMSIDTVEIVDSNTTVIGDSSAMTYDTVWKKRFFTETFYFWTKVEFKKYKDLKLEAIQVKGSKPVYVEELSEIAQWWIALDPKWKAKIREQVNIPEAPSDYMLQRIHAVKEIDLSGMTKDELGVLSQFKGIQKLNLAGWGLDTLDFLSEMPGLRELRLENNELRSLEGIQNCPNLEGLYLMNNEIIDLSPLKACVNLYVLNFNNNHVVDISPLKELTRLTTLHMGSNDIEDLSPISGLIGMKRLSFHKNRDIKSLEPLARMGSLMKLNMYNTQITSLTPIKGCVNIYDLNMGYVGVKSLDAIRNFSRLKKLTIAGNLITDFSALNNFRDIRELNVSKTSISDIGPINRMEYIKELVANNTKLSKADIQNFKKKHPKCQISYW